MSEAADPAAATCAIGAAAARLGVSTRALRYYEQVGLLTPAARTEGGNRLYSDADLARVARIRELQDLLGADLETIRSILAGEDRAVELRAAYRAAHPGDDDTQRAVLAEAERLYRDLIAQLDDKLARMQAFRDELDARLQRVLDKSGAAGR